MPDSFTLPEARKLAAWMLATAAAYALILPAQFPLAALVAVPQLDLGTATEHAVGAAALFVGAAIVVYLAYAKAYTLARRIEDRGGADLRAALAIVFGGAALFSVVLLWTYPVGAVDVYDYAYRARMWLDHGLNPLVAVPERVSGDPWLAYVAWTTYPSPYGAFWTIVSTAIYRLAGSTLLGSLLSFKLVAVASLLAASWLVYAGLRGTGRALSGALLVAWNPLVLFELAVNAHNDGLMMLLVVGAIYLFEQRRCRMGAWLCLALAAQVKIIAIVFVPVLIVSTLNGEEGDRGRLGRAMQSVAVGLLVCAMAWALMYAPLWAGEHTLDGIWLLQERFTSSLAAVAKLAIESAAPADASNIVSLLFASLGAAGLACVLWCGWRYRRPASSIALAALWPVLALGTLWFQPWYAVWLVVLAPFGGPAQRRAVVLVSGGALALYLLYDFAWFWQPALFNAGNTLAINAAAVVLWLLAPLTVSWLYARRRSAGLPQSES